MVLKKIDIVVAGLLVAGGLNWGLIGLFNLNLVDLIFGGLPYASRIIYSLVALGALYQVFQWRAIARRWECTIPIFRVGSVTSR
jgi:uncharacterized protein